MDKEIDENIGCVATDHAYEKAKERLGWKKKSFR